MQLNRRTFIRSAALLAAGNAAGLGPMGMLNAAAQSASTSDYKALVCVFLSGGNDANNMIVPFDASGYAQYASARGPLALAQKSLVQSSSMPDFALHPSLDGIRSLIDGGQGAAVANVGTLVQPLTRAQYLGGGAAPAALFSHLDQSQEWQNASSSGQLHSGWAGRIADQLGGLYNPNAGIPMITSLTGDSLLCDGTHTSALTVAPGNIGTGTCSAGDLCAARTAAQQAMLSFDSGVSLVQADNQITANAFRYASVLADATRSALPLQTVFPAGNGLAVQLKQVAQIMQVRAALGVKRQIFFCNFGSFDTHTTQLGDHANLLQTLNDALVAFYQATVELGLANNVTTFTMSEFSRALQPNSESGTDHAWGSHHLVFGGAVKGRRDVRDLSYARTRRPGRRERERPMDPDDLQRAVWRHVGQVVRRKRVPDARDFSGVKRVFDSGPWVYGVGLSGVPSQLRGMCQYSERQAQCDLAGACGEISFS